MRPWTRTAVQSYMFGQSPATVDYECSGLTSGAGTPSVPVTQQIRSGVRHHVHRSSRPHHPALLHRRRRRSSTGAGDTIADLLTDLDAQFPGLRARLVTDDGALHRFVNVYVNDEDVRFLGALDAKLNDGDTVTILPAVAGGAFGFAAVAAMRARSAAHGR